ncbi:hypothetical protein PTKU15_80020 [Paraburkholderia terrae]|nr:hypothetical protein PTKU15_80020 [Paraburkholderia terrae]
MRMSSVIPSFDYEIFVKLSIHFRTLSPIRNDMWSIEGFIQRLFVTIPKQGAMLLANVTSTYQ